MKQIGLLSDTHGYLDDRILHYLGDCDEIWHAGDIGNATVSDTLSNISTLRAVYGNIDGGDIRKTFPKDLFFAVEGMKVCMTHIAGRPNRYPKEVKDTIEKERPDIFICGHSHILLVQKDQKSGMLHLNPGAAGVHGFHKVRTLLKFKMHEGKIENLTVVELGNRSRT